MGDSTAESSLRDEKKTFPRICYFHVTHACRKLFFLEAPL